MKKSASTIRFKAKLIRSVSAEKTETEVFIVLPANVNAKLPAEETTRVEGVLNAFPFRATVERDGQGRCGVKVNNALQVAIGAVAGDSATVEITRINNDPETLAPADLIKALAASSHAAAQAMWANITPMARRDWILWIATAKQIETRAIRIEKACSMLGAGKRRVCCFGGLNWLTKDHPAVETWLPLPVEKKDRDGPGTRNA